MAPPSANNGYYNVTHVDAGRLVDGEELDHEPGGAGLAVSRPAARSTLTCNAPAAPLFGLHTSPPARAANRPARGFTHSIVRFLVDNTGLTSSP